jgi:hypothetical protein
LLPFAAVVSFSASRWPRGHVMLREEVQVHDEQVTG